ncbi:hypothetical protein BU26DRAFT_523515 [Trematosphaeria pertusa]|uniref:Ketoreductase (KR) domain-containing protein n=1 Tax=Trematosphaeria pertusa TaxID=390896 RepID=A0A6A6I269_9PLEO|nr:uncharacterized protein BU26DRAFT_523515 [Trematosphaeria pertusa]KAF2243963.1 hypothetical protein BU26DRAFT_523515 [Trematosphaeria pertusa]
MSAVIAVAGGSGGLGRAIVDVLKADSRYEVVILARKVRPLRPLSCPDDHFA